MLDIQTLDQKYRKREFYYNSIYINNLTLLILF